MHRPAIPAVLGAALVICTYITDKVYSDSLYIDRINEKIRYSELGADPDGTYDGYTVEELGYGYKSRFRFFGKDVINFPVICQLPELPTGCEVTCAAALLNFLGFDISKTELSDNYMRKSSNFYVNDLGESFGPDPSLCFAGDPMGHGYGCYDTVIVQTINNYLKDVGALGEYRAMRLDRLNPADMEKLIDEGVPIIVWASSKMGPYRYSEQSKWTATGSSKEITWLGNSHTLVLVGYDLNAYYFMDCSEVSAIVPYSKEAFVEKWKENGSQNVIVKIFDKEESGNGKK